MGIFLTVSAPSFTDFFYSAENCPFGTLYRKKAIVSLLSINTKLLMILTYVAMSHQFYEIKFLNSDKQLFYSLVKVQI